ncbi:hypothetical protein MTR_0003s0080 [Medicago truncatula]|uniref:Uncharacterized protein n=1 Tax=Medicago truncatula TaxID=3880 RepID=A0A072TVU6_MEDTR|nr:hypothetical protein MTR_0003s0080 [Medicago truncatula]
MLGRRKKKHLKQHRSDRRNTFVFLRQSQLEEFQSHDFSINRNRNRLIANHISTTAQMEVDQDSYDFDITMEVVEDSYDSVTSEVVQQVAAMVHAEEDEVQSKQTEENEVQGVHIEKFPEYEYENDSYEEKEYKKENKILAPFSVKFSEF